MDSILIGAVIAPSLSVIIGIVATYFISKKDTDRIISENKKATLAMVYAVSKSVREDREITIEDISKGYEISESIYK